MFEAFAVAWPWIGLGVALVMIFVLFGTDLLRSGTGISRWRDPVWLAWFAVPYQSLHVFEEYACHMTGGEFDIVTTFASNPIFPSVPYAHFPLGNMVFAFLAIPLAAWLTKRNPAIGLSVYGLWAVNGLMHVVQPVAMGTSPFASPGFFTGAGYLVLLVWMSHVTLGNGVFNAKGLAITLVAGVVGHVALFGTYGLLMVAGPVPMLVWDVIVGFVPPVLAALFSGGLSLRPTLRGRARNA